MDEEGADLLFQLVSARYEHRSTVITTNVAVGLWADVFGDAVTAAAIADRVCHHCTMLKITGRLRMKAALLAEAADADGLPEGSGREGRRRRGMARRVRRGGRGGDGSGSRSWADGR